MLHLITQSCHIILALALRKAGIIQPILARVSSVRVFGVCTVLGVISHGDKFVLTLHLVNESILENFVGFSSP